jgi:replicative DNA helicase
MAGYGESFLSKILDEGTIRAIQEHQVEEYDFPTEVERNVFNYIVEYAKENGGKTPDYRTVIEREPDFYYREGVTDTFEYLVKELKSNSAKRRVVELFEGNPDENGRPTTMTVEDVINEKDGIEAIEYLISQLEHIRIRTDVRSKVGTSLKFDSEKIKQEYLRRKQGISYKVWQSSFPFINRAIGGYTSSNVYGFYGKSGRGKSAITLKEAVFLANEGANVLIWSMEMPWFEVAVRLFTYYSRLTGGVATQEIDGVDMEVGFNSSDLRHAKLSEDFERKFFEFIDSMNDLMKGNIIIRAVDDPDFTERSLRALESDIIRTEADVVVVDPFYYLDYERNTSRTAGGDAANTSRKLRRLAGVGDTVIFAITQADEVSEETDEEGNRELSLPQRKDVSKTKQLLQDAATLVAVDTDYRDGRGLIGINKGRDGGEGEHTEIIYLPQYGIIEEMSISDKEMLESIKQF